MKTLQHWLVLLAAGLAWSAQAATNDIGTLSLAGKVVDVEGRPVAGAVVERYQYVQGQSSLPGGPEVQERVTTDSKGAFQLHAAPSLLILLARKPDLAPAWKQFKPTPGDEPRLVLVSPGALAGLVVDETDKPVAGATVSVAIAFSETLAEGGGRSFDYLGGRTAQGCFSTRTSADGRFRIDGFPTNAAADLTVRVPGKALRRPARESWGPDTMQCRAGDKDIRLVVEPAGSIEGRIVAEGPAQPPPMAQLTLQNDLGIYSDLADRAPAETAPDGTFRLQAVPAGSYRIQAVFGTNVIPQYVAEPVKVTVETGRSARDVEIMATRGGVLEVATLGKKDQKPLERVAISASKDVFRGSAVSGSNGLTLLRLMPGDYQVSASAEGFSTANATGTVELGKTNRLELGLAPTPRITGIVRRTDGQPAAGLAVQIVGAYGAGGGKAKTDAKGQFDLPWDGNRYGQSDVTFCLLIRDPERNLAVAQDIDEETGPLDLKLAPALALAGRAECDGKPVTNAGAALVFWAGNRGMHLTGLSVGTNTPGRFEIPALPPGRKYGLYVSAPGYGQKYLQAVGADAEAGRVELDPVELKVANLKLAGKVVNPDEKPAAGAYVNLSGEGQPSASARTDREGRFSFGQVCEGQVRLSASAGNSHGSLSVEAGDTNVVLRLGEVESYASSSGTKPHKLKGLVIGPDAKPVVGAEVTVFPTGGGRGTKTGTNGSFNLTWALEAWQMQDGSATLVVRDLARHLAIAEELSDETTNLTLRLQPGLTLTGRVEEPNGRPLTNAQVGVWLLAGRTYSQVDERLATTDAQGAFQVKALPADLNYTVFATAKGHGRNEQRVQADSETNRLEVPTFVLKVADKVLAGQVVSPDDKPVSGAQVSLSGEDQPQTSTTTDSKGRFKFEVCDGSVRLFASAESSYANASAEAGDTNLVIQLARNEPGITQARKTVPLRGKPLPDLVALGFAAQVVPKGKPVLLCILDVEQRPSRRLARVLKEQYDVHRAKGLTVLVAQAAATDETALKEWTDNNPAPFPVGRVPGKSGGAKWASGVDSLPWLILTDAQGRVISEGFAIEELDGLLQGL